MPGPGEYRPDTTGSITRIEDVPKPNIWLATAAISGGDPVHGVVTVPTATASSIAPSTTSATR